MASAMTAGHIRPGEGFSATFLQPVDPFTQQSIDKLMRRVEERGGTATKITDDTTVTVRVYPRGEK